MERASALGTATVRLVPPAEARVVEFPGTPDRTGRTLVCSVLFLDIVEYSKRPVGEQLQVKERFNAQVSHAIAEIPAPDRIILDTGDGVAISFLDDPEDALCVALALTHWFTMPGGIPVRAGINLGPVRLTRDINGQPNIIGDGINVAQRVMTFARPGQLLVSRAFHDTVSRSAESYTELFSYQGSRTDKHVREHEIFELSAPVEQALEIAERRRRGRRRVGGRAKRAAVAAGTRLMARRALAFGVAALSLAALGAALIAFVQPDGAQAPERIASQLAEQPVVPPPAADAAVPAASAPPPQTATSGGATVHPAPSGGKPSAAVTVQERAPDPVPVTAPARAQREPAAGDADADTKTVYSPSKSPPSAERPPLAEKSPVSTEEPPVLAERPPVFSDKPRVAAEPAAAAPAAKLRMAAGPSAVVLLAISPWGEVYVNGRPIGVSPPLAELELAPGKHRIEVRNGAFKPYREDMQLGSNQTVRIKHKFTR